MDVRIHGGDIHLLDLRTRMPFRYGIATMTHAPHAFVRLHAEIGGRPAVGIAADLLPPKWFTKDPNRPIREETHEMLRVIENALRLSVGMQADSPFDAWMQVERAQAAWGREQGLPPLLTQFGTSLIERAVIEATCKAVDRPFPEALRDNVFGVRLGKIHAALTDLPWNYLFERLRARPQVTVRHTVGMADPLTEADIPPGERLGDGLPQSLEASIRAYGLRAFKIKVSGQVDADRERLRRVAGVTSEHVAYDGLTLDGNEQFHSMEALRSWWAGLLGDRDLRPFLEKAWFVEQPLHRSVALDPAHVDPLRWPRWGRVIIDESDAELHCFPRALELGYWGTSHKNCKGVFKSVANEAFIGHWRSHSEGNYVLSGEDLANVGPVALLQDLVVCSVLNTGPVERNGHHYFAGLSMFPSDIQQAVLQHHADLYRPSSDGWPTLAIRDGAVSIDSLLRAPFGVGFEVPVEQFLTPDAWRRANPLVPERDNP
jgi:hypothetical protein